MRKIYLAFVVVVSLLATGTAHAQCDPVMLPDSMQYLTNGMVFSSTQLGNTLYLGGNFSLIGQNTGHFIGIDTFTGHTVQRATWPKVNGTVRKAIPDGAGGWIVGGTFTMVGDSARNNIARIDASGHVTSFNPGTNGSVLALYVSGTTVYAGGAFTNAGGVTRNRIAAVNMTTGAVTSWNPNANQTVRVIYQYNDRLYVGGDFTTIGGQSRQALAVINTTSGNADAWNANVVGSYVQTITGANGLVYIGGQLDVVGAIYRQDIAAIDTATATATSWNPSANGPVYKIIVNTTTAYIGGTFDNIGSMTRHGIAEVSLATGLATSFNPAPAGLYTYIYDMAKLGSRLYIGGRFDALATTTRYNIAAIDIPTGVINGWTCETDDSVLTLAGSGSRIYAGGSGFMTGCRHRSYAGAIDVVADTVTAWDPQVNYIVRQMTTSPTAVFLGGDFTIVAGADHKGLVSTDLVTGQLTSSFNCDVTWGFTFTPGTMRSMVYYNGILYFCGVFDHVRGTDRINVAAVNGLTGVPTSWNPNPSLSFGYALNVNVIAVGAGNILLGGSFNSFTVGGAARTNFAELDPITGNATSWAPVIDGGVTALTVTGNTLFIGGGFSYINTTFAPRLAKVNLVTHIASTWAPYPDGGIDLIVPFQNIAFVTGSFGTINALSRQYLTTIDTTFNTPGTWNPSPSFNSPLVAGINIFNDNLFISGGYLEIDGNYRYPFLTRYKILAVADTIHINGNTSVCAGTTVTLTAATNVTGGTYRWRVNGVAAGTGSTYAYVPANGDQVTCTGYVPTGSCYTTDSALSNTLVMTVTPYTTPTVSITTTPTVCAGTTITITSATGVTGATYQWQVNSLTVGTDSTYSYIPVNGDNIQLKLVPPAGCFSPAVATSNTVTMTVNANLDALTSVTASATTVCAGTPVTYHAHGLTGMHYQWRVNGAAAGPDDSTYSYTPAAGDMIHVVATPAPGGCYINSPDSTSNITITVIADTTPVVTITGASSLCAGSADTFHLTSNIPLATYNWFVNGVAITGATSAAYMYTPAAGDHVTAVLTTPLTGCYSAATDTSNNIALTVNVNVSPLTSVTADATTLCAGNTVHLNCMTNITGAAYQWKVNGFNAGTGAATYNYNPLNGDVVLCEVTAPAGSCYTQGADTSNSISLVVNPVITPTIDINGPGTVSPGNTVTITGTVSNAGSTYLITWYKNGVVFNTSSVNYASYVKDAGLIDTIKAKIVSQSPGCYDSVTSNTIYVYGTVGIEDVAHAAISVYPNPFADLVTVKGMEAGDRVMVYDVVGRKVYDYTSTGNTDQLLHTGNLASGSYIVHITTADGAAKANMKLEKL